MAFRFNIKVLFGGTAVVACIMAIIAYSQYWLLAILFVVLLINLLGAIAAVVLTKLLGFPTDGGYRDPVIRADQEARVEVEGQTRSNK